KVELAEGDLATAKAEASEAYRCVEAERERRRLLLEIAALPEANASAAKLHIALARALDAKRRTTAERERASELSVLAKSGLEAAQSDKRDHDRQLGGEREALQAGDTHVSQIEEALRGGRESIPVELRQKAEAGQLSGPDTVEADLKLAEKRLSESPP